MRGLEWATVPARGVGRQVGLVALTIATRIVGMIRGVAVGIGFLMDFVGMVSGILAVTLGAWDFLVWLFNADWQTTHFKVPLGSLAVFIVTSILSAIVRPVAEWGERAKEWCEKKAIPKARATLGNTPV